MALNSKGELEFADTDISETVLMEENISIGYLKNYISHEKSNIHNYESKVNTILEEIDLIPKDYTHKEREQMVIKTTCTITYLERCLQNKRECLAILERLTKFKENMIKDLKIDSKN